MKSSLFGLLAAGLLMPGMALADPAAASTGAPAADSFSYSTLEVNQLGVRSNFFDDRSSGRGLKFSYDSADMVYVLAQWNHLNFDRLPGSHNVYGLGLGAHQAYNPDVSFYIDASFMRDQLDAKLGSAVDDYWRVNYGFRSHVNSVLEFDGAIFTERSTDFGRRPFGEHLGFGLDFGPISVMGAAEHTADGNRTQISLVWSYR
ncbi:MAG TPA: hypothetical protein VGT99_04100 [Gammaproteobacteria bacterium]|nr:hypothetical protein [Gammaproteobacteria bacterium]